MINEYFTLLASLEYNMQEMYRVQKLANDLVDITVTVIYTLLYIDSMVYDTITPALSTCIAIFLRPSYDIVFQRAV